MTSTGKTTSIARRIAWRFQWGKLWRILWQTVALFCVCTAVWCVATAQAADAAFPPEQEWYLQQGQTADDLSTVSDAVLNVVLVDPSYAVRLLRYGGWNVYDDDVIFHAGDAAVEMGGFLFWLGFALECLLALRLLFWLLSSLRATGRIRRYLKPIDDIAQVTESISSHGFDESKFHSLETAIDHLGGVSPDELLHTGDSDLAGLETAVNNLIARMHAGYRQQVRFVDDASHELRTPIAVIQGYADMLSRWGKTDEKVLSESIRAIQTEAAHMKTLVEQLLFLARGDAGRQELNMRPLDLAALTREVWEESRMIDEGHEYAQDAPEPVPVRGDEALLKQAVRILVDNARKYSPPDSRITLRAYSDGTNACADVQDNGVGISAADAPQIFDRFFRGDGARTADSGGSGLGLSIARWIVTRHGGHFQVRSYEGVGTRMTIVLPLSPASGDS